MSDELIRCETLDGGHQLVQMVSGANLFSPEFVAAFSEALDRAEHDHPGAAVVTTGDGKYYSNGFDLEYLGAAGDGLFEFIGKACGLLARILTFPAPTVAALNGHAFGIGAMLALAHDTRVMRSDRGWWCLPEVDLGMPFHPFMDALIKTRLPRATAEQAMLTGMRYDGAVALDAGIANATADESSLLSTAIATLDGRTGKTPAALGTIKRQLHAEITAKLELALPEAE